MRIEVSARNVDLVPVLRHYAEARAWVALQRVARRPTWVGVRLTGDAGSDTAGRTTSQFDAWLRGVGLVTARYSDTNPYLAIDCAAVLLGQAVARRLRKAGIRPSPEVVRAAPGRFADYLQAGTETPPRLAVLVRPSGARSRVSIRPWLRARYGIDEVQTITLSRGAWGELASGGAASAENALRARLALAVLGRPEVIVVLGDRPAASSASLVSRNGAEPRDDVIGVSDGARHQHPIQRLVILDCMLAVHAGDGNVHARDVSTAPCRRAKPSAIGSAHSAAADPSKGTRSERYMASSPSTPSRPASSPGRR